ncbi:MAG TPA: hypothetical protein VFB62_15280, partial [Polyangiaceae bacterium]|nr:hypothetical protein [Polyangiaceae bacterium]
MRRPDGGLRYVVRDYNWMLSGGMAFVWFLTAVLMAMTGGSYPWWCYFLLAPLPLIGLHRRGLDVHTARREILLWASFGFRYWRRVVPLMVPESITKDVDYGAPTDDRQGTRRVTTLWFGAIPLKNVNRKGLGRIMNELRFLVA